MISQQIENPFGQYNSHWFEINQNQNRIEPNVTNKQIINAWQIEWFQWNEKQMKIIK